MTSKQFICCNVSSLQNDNSVYTQNRKRLVECCHFRHICCFTSDTHTHAHTRTHTHTHTHTHSHKTAINQKARPCRARVDAVGALVCVQLLRMACAQLTCTRIPKLLAARLARRIVGTAMVLVNSVVPLNNGTCRPVLGRGSLQPLRTRA